MAISLSCVFLDQVWVLRAGAGAAASLPHLPAEVADGRDGADVGQQDCEGNTEPPECRLHSGLVTTGYPHGLVLKGQEEASGARGGSAMRGARSREEPRLRRAPVTPAGPAREPGRPWSSPAPARSSPRAPKPVFQASGVCRSDVLTAQVAKATNTKHMSFWLRVKEGRGPRSPPGREKHTLCSGCPLRHLRPKTQSGLGHS